MKEIYVARVGMCVHGGDSPMHRCGSCWVSGGTPAPAAAVGGLWAAAAALLLTNWELKQKHKAQTPLQLFTERPRNPGQNCCVYERGTFGCFPLWHRKECVEAETDRRLMDGGKNRRRGVSLGLVSPSRRLFGEFADDTNQSSIFIL